MYYYSAARALRTCVCLPHSHVSTHYIHHIYHRIYTLYDIYTTRVNPPIANIINQQNVHNNYILIINEIPLH